MGIDKETGQFIKRVKELALLSQLRYVNNFTSFLSLNEISEFYKITKEIAPVSFSVFGGTNTSERKMICFHGEEYLIEDAQRTNNPNEVMLSFEKYVNLYPIDCIQIEPISYKFSDDLTHRDYLGALMNLGIDRSKIGDILLEEKKANVFCCERISNYIVEQLQKVKHTNVKCMKIEMKEFHIEQKYMEVQGTVSSIRLDSMIAVAFHTSRSSIKGYIEGGKVFVNGKEIVSNSYVLKENDILEKERTNDEKTQ